MSVFVTAGKVGPILRIVKKSEALRRKVLYMDGYYLVGFRGNAFGASIIGDKSEIPF